MAQHRFIKYQDPITSFEANEKYAGIIEPSLYRGFDNITNRSALNITIGHALTGEVFTTKSETQTPPRGIWVSKQGVIIKEDAPITLLLTSNLNNYERWDILVAEHVHDELNPGGLPATYHIIPGGNQTEPTLPNPAIQVVLGRIRVPANATSSTAVVWERRKIPQLGNKFPALLFEDNRYTKQNQENQAAASITTQTVESGSRRVITALNDGNSFLVSHSGTYLDLLPEKPAGTLITLVFNADITIRGYGNQTPTPTSSPGGYSDKLRPIVLSISNLDLSIDVKAWESVTLRMIDSSGSHATRRPAQQYWSLVGITNAVGTTIDLTSRMALVESGLQALTNKVNDPDTGLDVVGLSISAHQSNTHNPHNVTKSQVGLGQLPNAKSDNEASNDSEILATTALTRKLYDAIAGLNSVPTGVIMLWSGSTTDIPIGWALCDGQNGTPDLRSRFVMGASESPLNPARGLPADAAGMYGGESMKKPAGATGGMFDRQLTLSNIPPHRHFTLRDAVVQGGNTNITASNSPAKSSTDGNNYQGYSLRATGTQEPTVGRTSEEGGSGGTTTPFSLLPPYVVLAYIMKL